METGRENELLEQAREQTRLLRSLQGYVMFWTAVGLLGAAVALAAYFAR